MGNHIRKVRKNCGLNLEDLADSANLSPGYLSRMETGGRNVSLKNLEKIARALGVTQAALVDDTHRQVLIVGNVGAGSEAAFYAEADPPNEWVAAPDNATANTVAVRIRGVSLGPLLDGWLAFYDDVRDPPGPELAGRMCVVGLDDGRVLIKGLKRGRDGAWTLLSNAEAPIYDATVIWAALVKHMRPG